MSKPKITVDNDPNISVASDSFITSFRKSDQRFQFRTQGNSRLGSYYMALSAKNIDELIEFLKAVKKQFNPKATGEDK